MSEAFKMESKASASQLIFKKMIDIMCEIGPVSKDQKNQAQGFKFRGIDQFINALHPALAKHRVFMSPRVASITYEMREVTRNTGKVGMDKHVHLQVEYTFFAEDGSFVVIGPIAAEGLDSGDKATAKALSAGLKYALIQAFSIPTEDMAEGDAESPEIAPRQHQQAPKAEAPSFSEYSKTTVVAPKPALVNPMTQDRAECYRQITNMLVDFKELCQDPKVELKKRYGVEETKLMTVEQLQDLVKWMPKFIHETKQMLVK
jgi:hypothetical protein